jgi:parallel beta-helix repeat protein
MGGCQYNNIYWNNIVNDQVGIESYGSANNNIYANNIADCNVGISLSGSDQNRIFQNNITTCGYAVNIRGSDNALYNNNFVENGHQVSISHQTLFTSDIITAYSTNNAFDLGYPLGGNFWSDYNGTDANQDGIGDTPYIINENHTDRYPLMNPFSASIALQDVVSAPTSFPSPTSEPTSPEPQPSEPFPLTLTISVAGIIAAICIGLLVHLKKNKTPSANIRHFTSMQIQILVCSYTRG